MKRITSCALLFIIGILFPFDADAQTKRIIASQDYETETAADWICPNGTMTLKTDDAVYGKYVEITSGSGSGNRSAYKSVSYDTPSNGYITDEMSTEGYVIEFDASMRSGKKADRSQSQFIVPTTGPNLATNATYSGTDYIFALSQKQITASDYSTEWYINDLSNTGTPVTLKAQWYHYTLKITASGVNYTIQDGSNTIATGNLQLITTDGSLPSIKGFWSLVGREGGVLNFDNMVIYDYVAGEVAAEPQVTLIGINGKERSYRISFADGETLHYTLPGSTDEVSVTEGTSIEVKTSTSGTLYAYTTRGTAKSSVVETAVEAVEITLNAPTYSVSNIGEGYVKEYTVNVDNSSVLLSPTATLSYVYTPAGGTAQASVDIANGGKISSDAAGTYVITASAAGYTSSELVIKNDVAYAVAKEYKFSEMTEADFPEELWTKGTDDDSRWGWSESSLATKYELNDPTTNAATAIDGINLFSNKTPIIYIGYGLMASYDGSGNEGVISINDATADQYAVYTRLNNYGNKTMTDVQKANESYKLYRYSDMLKNIKVYSPAQTVTVNEYSTFSSTSDVDFSAAEGLTVYTAKLSDAKDVVTLTEVADKKVPAGQGVLLKGTGEFVGFTTTGVAAFESNDLIANTEATAVTREDNIYVLNNVDGIGFYPFVGTLTVGKAHLVIEGGNAKSIKIAFGGDTTGISNVESTANGDAKVWHTLSGVRVQNPTKGLYIVNGKKVVVK